MPIDPNMFYVYVLFDWLGVPRYAGKGRGQRWLAHERGTDPVNLLKNEFIEQTWIMIGEVPKVKVREGLTNAEACATEIALISAIGRIDLGTGPLVNMTGGGDGGVDLSPAELKRRNAAIKRSWKLQTEDERERRWRPMVDAATLARNNQTVEQRSAQSRNGGLATVRTPEQMAYMLRSRWDRYETTEQRREQVSSMLAGRKAKWDSLTAEERSTMGRNASMAAKVKRDATKPMK